MRLVWLVLVLACHHGTAAPPAATCAAAAEHVRELLARDSAYALKVRDVFATRCEADEWGAEARACIVATASLRRPRHCKAKLTDDQRKALDRELGPLAETRTDQPACDVYRRMIDRLASCSGLPPFTREASEVRYITLQHNYADLGDGYAPALQKACKANADALRESVATTCGW